jgi:hypothetical protein
MIHGELYDLQNQVWLSGDGQKVLGPGPLPKLDLEKFPSARIYRRIDGAILDGSGNKLGSTEEIIPALSWVEGRVTTVLLDQESKELFRQSKALMVPRVADPRGLAAFAVLERPEESYEQVLTYRVGRPAPEDAHGILQQRFLGKGRREVAKRDSRARVPSAVKLEDLEGGFESATTLRIDYSLPEALPEPAYLHLSTGIFYDLTRTRMLGVGALHSAAIAMVALGAEWLSRHRSIFLSKDFEQIVPLSVRGKSDFTFDTGEKQSGGMTLTAAARLPANYDLAGLKSAESNVWQIRATADDTTAEDAVVELLVRTVVVSRKGKPLSENTLPLPVSARVPRGDGGWGRIDSGQEVQVVVMASAGASN